MSQDKISNMINTALENIRGIADVNTIIGKPIMTVEETQVIPVSKVSMGFTGGGTDYVGKNAEKARGDVNTNFIGGSGAGVTITPVAFLVIDKNGNVSAVNLGQPNVPAPSNDLLGTVSALVEKSPDIIERLKAVFSKKESKAAENAETAGSK